MDFNFEEAGRQILPPILPLLLFLRKKKKEKARNGIEKRIIECTDIHLEYILLLPSEERRYQKRRRCGSRREEWVSLFDRNLAAKGEDEEEDTKISGKKWRGEKKTGGKESERERERAGGEGGKE